MGMPLQDEEPTSVPPAPNAASATPPAQASQTRASTLPPEAIALAGKLFDFARAGSTSELETYLAAGIPLNLTNHKGDTLVMLAAYHGHVQTVSMLIARGADMNVLNDRGQSPIAGAVFKGYDDVVRVMAEAGADVRAGQPCAVDAARMFRREGCLRMFGVVDES